jgi:hypothetical protein
MLIQRTPISNATNMYDFISDTIDVMIEEPKRVNMAYWILRGPQLDREITYNDTIGRPDCNTVGCQAGWFALLANRVQPTDDMGQTAFDTAMRLLSGQANVSRYTDPMLKDFGQMFSDYQSYTNDGLEPGTLAYAMAVADRLRAMRDKWADRLRSTPVYISADLERNMEHDRRDGERRELTADRDATIANVEREYRRRLRALDGETGDEDESEDEDSDSDTDGEDYDGDEL